MKLTETAFAKRTTELYRRGQSNGWLGMMGGSVSRWLTSRELMQCESELRWNGGYHPIGVTVPRLARECFLICRHDDVYFGSGADNSDTGLMVVQINDRGDMFRVLWENHPDNRPPLELCIHLTAHDTKGIGTGEVVYHCQPIHCLALAGMADGAEQYTAELLRGFAALNNLLPDGVALIPWGMPAPIRRGMPMNAEMCRSMEQFMERIRESAANHEAVVFQGEGILCAARDEPSCYMIINAVERAAAIRLAMLSAGAR